MIHKHPADIRFTLMERSLRATSLRWAWQEKDGSTRDLLMPPMIDDTEIASDLLVEAIQNWLRKEPACIT
jgi:hypothetical protein